MKWAYVNHVGEQPSRRGFAVDQQRERVENGVVVEGAHTLVLECDGLGHTQDVSKDHPRIKSIIKVMEGHQKRLNKEGKPVRLLGPFEDNENESATMQAISAQEKARPKSDGEVALALKVEVKQKDETIAELQKRIAELSKK